MTDLGTTFRGYDPGNHLWLILSLPNQHDYIALANFTSHWTGERLHRACPLILTEHDHPWIVRETCIFWDGAHLSPCTEIADGIRSRALPTEAVATPELVARIQETALRLPDIPPTFRNAIRATIDTD